MPETTPLMVMVVDDQVLIRAGLGALLRAAGHQVVEAGDGAEAIRLAIAERPDVVLMDVRMPGMSGIEATTRIVADNPAITVLMLSSFDVPEYVRAAVKAGAKGYILKTTAPERVIDAVVRAVQDQAVFIPAFLARALVEEPSEQVAALTAREREVLALAAQGMSSSTIAERLALSVRTVENHLARVYAKLGVNNRAQLARLAIDRGLDLGQSI